MNSDRFHFILSKGNEQLPDLPAMITHSVYLSFKNSYHMKTIFLMLVQETLMAYCICFMLCSLIVLYNTDTHFLTCLIYLLCNTFHDSLCYPLYKTLVFRKNLYPLKDFILKQDASQIFLSSNRTFHKLNNSKVKSDWYCQKTTGTWI